ncbi:MAG TPA: hypothetical protein VNW06_04595, partial [Cytophagaceae bacterium]|nr:hypothetical protein [Cytophagaceae bacterium]
WIGRSTFRTWAKEVYFQCNHSLLKLCSNSYPSQLTYQEVKNVRLLSHNRFIVNRSRIGRKVYSI